MIDGFVVIAFLRGNLSASFACSNAPAGKLVRYAVGTHTRPHLAEEEVYMPATAIRLQACLILSKGAQAAGPCALLLDPVLLVFPGQGEQLLARSFLRPGKADKAAAFGTEH